MFVMVLLSCLIVLLCCFPWSFSPGRCCRLKQVLLATGQGKRRTTVGKISYLSPSTLFIIDLLLYSYTQTHLASAAKMRQHFEYDSA